MHSGAAIHTPDGAISFAEDYGEETTASERENGFHFYSFQMNAGDDVSLMKFAMSYPYR
jgi:hypothetical protein